MRPPAPAAPVNAPIFQAIDAGHVPHFVDPADGHTDLAPDDQTCRLDGKHWPCPTILTARAKAAHNRLPVAS